ncbi:MAG: prepilin-type N-terminal cleavage/methylation domain-containing protein [Candidatus Gastranaerophilales bacterium]|nr:prepilin-type N-terminal cleavage/methylation domain-containing protein [Candidatus Gastranaerophilales bacterium]
MQNSKKQNQAEANKNIFCAVNSEGLTAFQGESDSSRRKCPMRARKRKAFTLAECLIVIAIIGVIASITVPMLFGTTSDAELKSKWKKVYGDLSQATMLVQNDNDGTLEGAFANVTTMRDKYGQYLNYVKSCDSSAALGVCWHLNDGSSTSLDGTPVTGWGDKASLIINNGMLLRFYYLSSACTNTSRGIPACGYVIIDVNGFSKPNVIGRDIFYIHVISNGIKPFGVQGDDYDENYCEGSTGSNAGYGCSASTLYN